MDNDHINMALCRNMTFLSRLTGETFVMVDNNTVVIGSLDKNGVVFRYQEWVSFDDLCPILKRKFISLGEAPLL